MRLVRMLGLAMAAAIAAMAFVGASAASAQLVHLVVLCNENPTELCPEGKLKKHIALDWNLEELTNAKGEKALHAVLLGQTNELCKKSKLSGKITNTSPLKAEITAATLEECTPCKKWTNSNLPYSVEFIHDLIGEHLWLEIIKPHAGGGPILLSFEECTFGVKCVFETNELHYDINNTASGLPLILTLENTFTLQAGFSKLLCGAEGKWDANYLTECLEPVGTHLPCWFALDVKEEA